MYAPQQKRRKYTDDLQLTHSRYNLSAENLTRHEQFSDIDIIKQ